MMNDRANAISESAAAASAASGERISGTDLACGPDETIIALVYRCHEHLTRAQVESIHLCITQSLATHGLDHFPVMVISGGADLRVEKVKKSDLAECHTIERFSSK